MNKWEAINKTGQIISKGINDLWDRKLRKDANIIVSDNWSNFILDDSSFLSDAQNHLEVGIDQKTGTLACLMDLPDKHPDYAMHNEPFAKYVLDNFNNRADVLIENTKNPYARESLQQKIGYYKENLANKISSFEANIVMDKRKNMAIEDIEKLSKATYNNPELYIENKETALLAINFLDIDPITKSKLGRKAVSEIAESAANSVLAKLPATILNPEIKYPWQQDLDAKSLIKFERYAARAVSHENAKNISEFKQLAEIHFKNIIAQGKGIDGIEEKLSIMPSDVKDEFLLNQELHLMAHDKLEQVKYAPLPEYARLLGNFANIKPGEVGYVEEQKLNKIIATEINKQRDLAKEDPAKFVEELFASELQGVTELSERIIDRIELQKQKNIPSYRQKMLTKEEREEFRLSLDSREANLIQSNLDNLLKVEFNHQHLGHKIVEEILQNSKLSALNHFYIDANLYSRGNVKNDLARAMASNQALGEMSNNDQKEIKKIIDEKLEDWQYSMLAGNTDRGPDVMIMQTGLLELARFYQFEKHLSTKEATDLAIDNLFNASYIAPYRNWYHGKFYIPKSVIDKNKIIEIDQDSANYALSNLRSNIIRQNIEYDPISSFGKEYYEGEVLDLSVVNTALREGAFRLSKDNKSIYYVYFDKYKDNSERPLLKSANEIFTIDLLELNKQVEIEDQMPEIELYKALNVM